MGQIVNINQQEPLKIMQHMPIMVSMKTTFASHYIMFLQSFFLLLFVIFSQTGILFPLVGFFTSFLNNIFLQFFPCMQCKLLLSDSCSLGSFLCSCRFTYKMSAFLLKKNGGHFQSPFEVMKRAFRCKSP